MLALAGRCGERFGAMRPLRKDLHPMRWLGLAIAALVVAGCASEPERILGDNWAGLRETPSGQEFTPEQANLRGIAGWAVIRCTARADMGAENCFILVETPAGWGFGAAALRTVQLMKAKDASSFPGQHVPIPGEPFNLPVVFCPPAKVANCQADAHGEITNFIAQVGMIQRALRANDCATAVSTATATGIASVAQRSVGQCAGRP